MEQQSLRVFGDVKTVLTELPVHEVALCRTYRDAIRLCMKRSYIQRTDEEWAEILGMGKGSISTILGYSEARAQREAAKGHEVRKRHFDMDKIPLLQREAGNEAVSQFLSLQSKGLLEEQREKLMKAEALEREARQLRESLS